MRQQRNYYEILGVSRTASPQEIKDRYLELARKYHPDRAADKDLAQRVFIQVNRSYTTLSNPDKRAVYDLRLLSSSGPPTSAYSYSVGVAPPASSPPGDDAVRADDATRNPTPGQVHAWLRDADAAQQRGEIDAALRLCRDAVAADPRNFPGLMLLGDLLARQGRQGDALAQYQCAAAIRPAHRDACEKIARIQSILARKSQAGASPPASDAEPAAEPPAASVTPAAPKKSLLDRLINLGR